MKTINTKTVIALAHFFNATVKSEPTTSGPTSSCSYGTREGREVTLHKVRFARPVESEALFAWLGVDDINCFGRGRMLDGIELYEGTLVDVPPEGLVVAYTVRKARVYTRTGFDQRGCPHVLLLAAGTSQTGMFG